MMYLREQLSIAWQDVTRSCRQLVRNPAFTIATVGTIALAVAGTGTMFGVMDRLLVRPPPHVHDGDRVGEMQFLAPPPPGYFSADTPDSARMVVTTVSYVFYEHLRRNALLPFSIASTTRDRLVFGEGSASELVRVEFASPGYFQLLGAKILAGRWIGDAEATPGSGARVAVVSHAFWRTRLGGDDRAVGRTLLVRGERFEIIGIAPRGFAGAGIDALDMWLPMAALNPAPRHGSADQNDAAEVGSTDLITDPFHEVFRLVVRLRDGITSEQAAAATLPAYSEQLSTLPFKPDPTRAHVEIVSLAGWSAGLGGRRPEATASIWLFGTAVVLLVVACANVATMLVLRAERRRRDIAVRLALGMSRRRLVVQLLLDGFVLAMVGAILAGMLTLWGGAAIQALLAPELPDGIWSVDARMVAVMMLATCGTAIIAGLLPALHARRSDLRSALSAGGAGVTGGTARRPLLQRPLLIAQAALSMALLVGAGLFLQSLHNVRRADLGIEPARVMTVSGNFADAGLPSPRIAEFFELAEDRARALPEAESVALSLMVPLSTATGVSIKLPPADSALVSSLGYTDGTMYNAVSPTYFGVTGARLVQGRFFGDDAVRGTPRVAIVSASMAERFWPDGRPLGRCILLAGSEECTTVVGVVRDPRLFRIREDPRSQVFVPLAQADPGRLPGALLIRTRGDAEPHTGQIRRMLQPLVPSLPHLEVQTLQSRLEPEVRPWRAGATLFSLFAAIATLLATVGLYSAMSYGVALRARELGIRMAVGASTSSIAGLVLRDSTLVAGIGLALGAVFALFAGARLEPLLYGVSARNAVPYLLAAGALGSAVLLASAWPTWRATKVDPVSTLRTD